jgi:serine-type D-Ala-D-Ala carboxypeptidase/endopeptidase (penicillin-binding protein 4)
MYFGETLRLHLQMRGVVFEGRIKKGVTPDNIPVLAEVESRRLGDILSDMNRFSNNFIAEHVLRAIGAEVYGAPSTEEKGLKAIKTYLNGIGLKDNEFQMANGSGFSTKNQFTGNAIIKFLSHIYKDFESGPEVLNSLSVSGFDGTIRRSLKEMKGRIRAKTGTMSTVRGLAGYMDAGEGRVLAFAIIANGANAPQMLNWEGKLLAICNGLH